MRINYKVIWIGLIFLLLYLGLSYTYFVKSLEELYNSKYKEVSQTMKKELEVLIEEKRESVLLIDISLGQNQNIKNVFLTQEIGDFDFNEYISLLKENTSLKNIWFHLVDSEGVSVYRSWTSKRGDSIVEVRPEIANVLLEPQMVSMVSIGKFDMTFKSMVPVYSNGEFLGIVETIASFNSIVRELKEYKYETLVLIDKKYKKQLTNTLSNKFIEDYYISSFSGSKRVMQSVLKNGVEYFLNIEDYIFDEESQQLFSFHKISTQDGEDMGYFIMSIALEDIDITSIEDSKERIGLGLVLVFVVITGFLLYLYMLNYKNFILKKRRELEDDVVAKTEKLKKQSEQMSHLAHYDSLTSLPNRLHFEKRLQEAIMQAKENEQELGVLFLDLDRFKEINDSYGHDVGDLLLQKITQRLSAVIREGDIVARLGGDEFTIIVHNTSELALAKIAKKIIYEIQKVIKIDNIELFVTFSIGLSLYPRDGESPEALLKYADTAMYKVKEEGKNGYQFYDFSMTELTMGRLALQNSLREAIRLMQFEPYYQPKIDSRSGKVVGLEALVRWNHPQRGMVPPLEFIPYAQELGLIVEIDTIMLYATLKQVKEWHKDGIKTGRLSLNISSKQLEDFSCVESFKRAISSIDFETKYLELEVTESQIMQNQANAVEVLDYIKKLGVHVSLDDFGTGYSSLAYLKNLPVDTLKIDRSFIQDIPRDENDVAIIKTIIALAENLKLDLIAEGVETYEQKEFLQKEGCYKIQGYYYSKPLNAKECREYLLAHL